MKIKNQMGKIFPLVFLLGFGSYSFSEGALSKGLLSDAAQTNQILMQMENQLQTLTTQQQTDYQNNSQFLLQTFYPSIPFPGWKSVSVSTLQGESLPNYTGFLGGLSRFDLGHFSVGESTSQRKQFLSQITSDFQAPLADSGVGGEINNYESLVSQQANQMTEVQALRLSNQLALLNAKASYIQYEQSQRLESLLLAEIYLQTQPQLVLEVSGK
jgi:hypothetical protein